MRNPAKINWITKTEELLRSGKFPKKAKWKEILRYLKNNGVTDDEIEAIFGADIDENDPYPVTAKDVQAMVDAFSGIDNVIYSNAVPDAIPMDGSGGILIQIHEATGSTKGDAKYTGGNYQTPGAVWTQEMVLYSRSLEPYRQSSPAHYGDVGGATPIVWIRFQYRLNEDDLWILFIDEIQQSDRLKAGKRDGARSFRRRPYKKLGPGWEVVSDMLPASAMFSEADWQKHLRKVYHRYQDFVNEIPDAMIALGYSPEEVESSYGKMGNPDRMEPGNSLIERFAANEDALFTFLDGPPENLPQHLRNHLYGTTGQDPKNLWDPSEFMLLTNEILGRNLFPKSFFKDYAAPVKMWYGTTRGNRSTDFFKTKASAQSAALKAYNAQMRGDSGVPWSPFQNPDDLVRLAMKAILSFACQIPGVAAVAWTNGVQQSVRNSRANHITGIEVRGSVKKGPKQFMVSVRTSGVWKQVPPDEATFQDVKKAEWLWSPNQFRTVFGTNIYDFIIPGFQADLEIEEAKMQDPDYYGGGGLVTVTVEDLNLIKADDSYADYYDRLIPSVVRKLTKKVGGKVVPVIETPIGSSNLDTVINLGIFKSPKLCAKFAGEDPMLMFNPPV